MPPNDNENNDQRPLSSPSPEHLDSGNETHTNTNDFAMFNIELDDDYTKHTNVHNIGRLASRTAEIEAEDEAQQNKYDRHYARGFHYGKDAGQAKGDVEPLAVAEINRRLSIGEQALYALNDDAIQSLSQPQTNTLLRTAMAITNIQHHTPFTGYDDIIARVETPNLPLVYRELRGQKDYLALVNQFNHGYQYGFVDGTLESLTTNPRRLDRLNHFIDTLPDQLTGRDLMLHNAYNLTQEIQTVAHQLDITQSDHESLQTLQDLMQQLTIFAIKDKISNHK